MTLSDKDEGTLTGCFAGLRVLDFSTTIAGPHCARMLADMGAEVIKIESSDGETMRTRPPLRNGWSTTFGQLNVGKKSLVLDLKSREGVDIVRRLVANMDVLVENFRPGVMHRLRLDYQTLSALNPKLIYCSISGYGQSGPSAELPAYAPVIHAASGYDMAHLAYQPGRERPDYCGIYHADVVTGTYAFGAISAALYAGIDADLDPERGAVVAIRGGSALAPDVRPDRDKRRLCHGRDRQRKDLSGPDERDRATRMGW
jgi:crotonobetainyl-CoA:carnitine CoA-transferase CaiB-like acyl-CoA transferase